MLQITKKISESSTINDTLKLPFDKRQKSRLRVNLCSGMEAALFLERGHILRGGDLLSTDDGWVVQVVAADEPVYQVTANSFYALTCAAYHLGNRHVPLQIGDGWLRLEQDYVLKDMLIGLGMHIEALQAPFEPEAGAYGGGHRHGGEDEPSANIRQPSRLRHG